MQEPFKFCSACGAHNNLSAQFCHRCGAGYVGVPPPVPPAYPQRRSSIAPLLIIVGALFSCCMVSGIVSLINPKKTTPSTSVTLTRSPSPFNASPSLYETTPAPILSPAEHIAEAKKLLKDPLCRYGCEGAAQHLNAIPSDAKEYKEARRLLGVNDERRRRGVEAAAAAERRRAAEDRKGRKIYEYMRQQGATAICEDGTYSFSAHRRGTCSHHGGVAQWLSR
jgi:hypothetical protein